MTRSLKCRGHPGCSFRRRSAVSLLHFRRTDPGWLRLELARSMALAPHVRLGPYEVTALIGEGGMGKVWRARHTALKRDDALKVLPDAFAADADRRMCRRPASSSCRTGTRS